MPIFKSKDNVRQNKPGLAVRQNRHQDQLRPSSQAINVFKKKGKNDDSGRSGTSRVLRGASQRVARPAAGPIPPPGLPTPVSHTALDPGAYPRRPPWRAVRGRSGASPAAAAGLLAPCRAPPPGPGRRDPRTSRPLLTWIAWRGTARAPAACRRQPSSRRGAGPPPAERCGAGPRTAPGSDPSTRKRAQQGGQG